MLEQSKGAITAGQVGALLGVSTRARTFNEPSRRVAGGEWRVASHDRVNASFLLLDTTLLRLFNDDGV